MKSLILFVLPTIAFAGVGAPAPFPVFLKAGFSSVLEFEEVPTRVVIGDSQSFQVEKLERSLVVRTLAPYASSNMFVYFNAQEPRLFVLSASEDAEPTYYKKFETPVVPKPTVSAAGVKTSIPLRRGTRILSAQFDTKKDYLTVEIEISADSREVIKPTWNLVRLKHNSIALVPFKLWAERQNVQKDSRVKARFIFVKPSIPRDLSGVSLIVPILGSSSPISLMLRGGSR